MPSNQCGICFIYLILNGWEFRVHSLVSMAMSNLFLMYSNVTFFFIIGYANLIVLILGLVDPRCQVMIFQALLVLHN